MQRILRIAIARIFSDLIKADRIIDTGEMDCWQRVCNRYSIDSQQQIEARALSLGEAITTIASGDESGLGADLLADCRSMTVSDGFCSHSEALLMVALKLCLNENAAEKAEVISIPRADFNIDTATAIYIENNADEEINEAIRTSHRIIFKEMQLAGLHFIYLPYIIDHYRRTDRGLFCRILSFLAPAISQERISESYDKLMKMTTAEFCKDILCNRCGISALRSTYPSLLIKISNNFVNDAPYSNYLRIEVADDILQTVLKLVDSFTNLLSNDIYVANSSEEKDNQFLYHGFYKQLLDIFLVRQNVRSRILLNPYESEIRYPDIDTTLTGVHRRERALYMLLLCRGEEGLNFNVPKGQAARERYDRRVDRIQRQYADIYGLFGGNRDQTPDLRIPEIRRPIFACLKRELKKLTALYNPDDYNVNCGPDKIYRVAIEPDLVQIVPSDSPNPIPLIESEIYQQIIRCS